MADYSFKAETAGVDGLADWVLFSSECKIRDGWLVVLVSNCSRIRQNQNKASFVRLINGLFKEWPISGVLQVVVRRSAGISHQIPTVSNPKYIFFFSV